MARGAWFDKLTMRDGVGCRELCSAKSAIRLAGNHLPHGELVEPRTHQNANYSERDRNVWLWSLW